MIEGLYVVAGAALTVGTAIPNARAPITQDRFKRLMFYPFVSLAKNPAKNVFKNFLEIAHLMSNSILLIKFTRTIVF